MRPEALLFRPATGESRNERPRTVAGGLPAPPRLARDRIAAALLALTAACSPAGEGNPHLVVSAASSLTDVMTELADDYSRLDPSVTIATNFASSGTLVQQIRQGAGVDLFVAAAEREMDLLAAEKLIEAATRRVVASNELVLIVPTGDAGVGAMADLASDAIERVALGAPASVPAGAYAREMLRSMGLWESVESKSVFTSNVRQALTYVERGEVDAALVYRTDAAHAPEVRIVAAAPPGSHAPIRYSAAVVAGSPRREGALSFLEFISSPEGEAVFRANGFVAPADSRGD